MLVNRNSLTGLTALAVGLFLAGQAVASDAAHPPWTHDGRPGLVGVRPLAPPAHPHWAYYGPGGPDNWAHLSTDYEACTGKQQSPVDLKDATPAQLSAIDVNYQPQPLAILNNGHTIQVNFKPGNFIQFEGDRYELLQYHFHHPSEHLVDGKKAPMEVHLVHRSAGGLTVLGVMMVPGKANPTIEALWNAMPVTEGPEKAVADVTLDPGTLLPAERGYFRYAGSLTTPPCSEVVKWVNLKQPIEVSEDQIERFAALFPMNARPAQSLHRRFILESKDK